MLIKIGFDIAFTAPQPTPMVVMLSVHPSRVADLVEPENIVCDPPAPIHYYHDSFGNFCGRLVVPQGRLALSNRADVRDSGRPTSWCRTPGRLRSRTCPTTSFYSCSPAAIAKPTAWSDLAWSLFRIRRSAGARVQAICDYVHGHMTFGYQFAAATKTRL